MFSKFTELTGIGLIALAIGYWARWEAGVLFAGIAVVLIGATTDDEAVGMALRRGTAWVRYGWWKQIAKENAVIPPRPRSPQPPIKIDPQAQESADRMARARQERSKVRDRTAALSKQEYDDELERLA